MSCSRIGEVTTPVLEFAARHTDTLPSLLTTFSHPVHVQSELSDTGVDFDAVFDNWP